LAVILGRERPLDVFYMKNPKKVIALSTPEVYPFFVSEGD
jgi:hypothetical protein